MFVMYTGIPNTCSCMPSIRTINDFEHLLSIVMTTRKKSLKKPAVIYLELYTCFDFYGDYKLTETDVSAPGDT